MADVQLVDRIAAYGTEIKASYEAEADTNAFTDAEKAKLATLTDVLSGDVSKTLGGGGDFATIAELFEWIADTPMSGVRLTVGVAVGTYAWDEQYVISTAQGLQFLYFQGAGTSANTTFECNVDFTESLFCSRISGTRVLLEDIKITSVVDAGEGQGVFAQVTEGGHLQLYQCAAQDFFEIAECQHATFELNTSQVTCVNYVTAGWPVWAADGSFVRMYASSVTGTGAKQYYGLYIDRMSKALVQGACAFVNLAGAIEIYEGSQIFVSDAPTLTTNTSDYNVTVNQIQGDGGFISTGGPLTLAA